MQYLKKSTPKTTTTTTASPTVDENDEARIYPDFDDHDDTIDKSYVSDYKSPDGSFKSHYEAHYSSKSFSSATVDSDSSTFSQSGQGLSSSTILNQKL